MVVRNILAALIVSLTLTQQCVADDNVLRIGTEGAYPPFNFIDEKGELAGFDVDIAKALCKEMDVKCSFVAVPWAEIIDELEKNQYDLIVASMARTEERAKRVEYSDSYYRSHSMFVADPTRFQDVSPKALAGMKIVAGEGTIQGEYLANEYGATSSIILSKDQPEAQKILEQGKADLLLGDAIELLSFLESSEKTEFEFIGDPVTNDFLQSTSHVTARKGETELIRQVNEAIKNIRLNGTYDRINDKYFPFSIY